MILIRHRYEFPVINNTDRLQSHEHSIIISIPFLMLLHHSRRVKYSVSHDKMKIPQVSTL